MSALEAPPPSKRLFYCVCVFLVFDIIDDDDVMMALVVLLRVM
jgi:hypothetical protein